MRRYSGFLGIAEQVEVRPGIWEEVITEVPVLGEEKQRTEMLVQGDRILPAYETSTSISVFARDIGTRDNSMIRYVTLAGIRWQIRSTVDQPPKLVIYIGEEYRGPIPVGAPSNP